MVLAAGQGPGDTHADDATFVVGGAAAAFFMALAKVDYFWIANVIYLGFVLWAIAGSVVKLIAYRRGL